MADNKISEIEASGLDSILHAIKLDKAGKSAESVQYYEQGLAQLTPVDKDLTDAIKKYPNRGELLKKEREASKEVKRIELDSTGHSYESLFGCYLNEFVTSVEIEDPNIQINNFLMLCELIVRKKIPVKKISLLTGKNQFNSKQQQTELRSSLAQHGIELKIHLLNTIYNTEIRLDTGWVIRFDRNLDYFKPCDRFNLGYSDFNLRQCYETTVEIFKQKSFGDVESSTN